MKKLDVVIQLEKIREAKDAWGSAHGEFSANITDMMRRLIHEAVANYMSAEEVAKASGFTTKRVRELMRFAGLNPKDGKRLLSQKAAEALANNSALLGIEPHEMDLMSPLAYLPMGEKMKRELRANAVSQVHEVSGNDFNIKDWTDTNQWFAERSEEYVVSVVDLLSAMGICYNCGESLPCLTCGHGL